MTKILVTGADGQLGRELRRLAGVTGMYTWVFTDVAQLDITDHAQVNAFFGNERLGVVVNCAAYTNVDGAEQDRDGAFRINAEAPAILAAAARHFDAAFIHISTDFVFDGSERRQRFSEPAHCLQETSGILSVISRNEATQSERHPYTEEDEPRPLNVYGASKLAGEKAVLDSGCRGAVVRTSWLYSPYGRNFVKSIMGAAAKNREISVVNDQWGNPTAADGLAGAVMQMIPQLLDRRDKAGLFQYCDTGVVSRSGFAEEIVRLSGADCRVIPVPSSDYPSVVERPAYSAMDTSKIGRVFGIVPRTWQEALAACVDRLKNNEE